MALDIKNLVELSKATIRASIAPAHSYSYSGETMGYDDLNTTLRNELNAIAGTYSLFRDNKNVLFKLIENTIDDVLPKKVMEQWGQFAEVKQFKQGDKAVFTQKITEASKRRAKQFITRVGLAGMYEVFKLDGQSYTVETSAYGGAAQIGFEEFLDGRVDWAVVTQIVMDGLDEIVYKEIATALIAATNTLQATNKASFNGFDEGTMDELLAISDAYGPTTIYCTFEFATKMIPASGWVSDAMKDQMWNTGTLGNYKGHKVVVLPQSFEDERNLKKVIDPRYAWLIPAGADKPVKIALEGQTIVDEYKNYDRSREIQVYKKMGVAALIKNNICVYKNTSLSMNSRSSTNWTTT